uniref:Uncharacterized protein n=1 Tax=Dulem virus 83 TaxID=3145794 RepID=A0AAU8AUE6_9VIRU
MINFFNQYGDYIFFAVYLLVSFVLYFRTRNNKYLMEVLNEVKYRLPDYREREPAEAQSFDTMKPVYRLNKQTNELELTDEVIDMQELLNSAKDYCLSACLERFLPTQTVDETVAQRNAYYDDLDIMTQYYDIADEYREKLGLDDTISAEKVYEAMVNKASELDKFVKMQQNVSASKNNNTEVMKDETKES